MPNQCSRRFPPNVVANMIVLAFEGLAIVTVVLLRVVVRARILRAFWWDDGSMILASVLTLCGFGLSFREQIEGMGNYFKCVPIQRQESIVTFVPPTAATTTFGTMFARISVALLLHRLFSISKTMKWALRSVTSIMVVSSFVYVVLVAYHPVVMKGPKTSVIGVVFTISDLFLASAPIFAMRTLQMPRQSKVGVVCMLSLGYVTFAFALSRTVVQAVLPKLGPDQLHSSFYLEITSELEASCAIIAGSIPTLRPLFVRKDKKNNHVIVRGEQVHFAANQDVPGASPTDLVNGPAGQMRALAEPHNTPQLPMSVIQSRNFARSLPKRFLRFSGIPEQSCTDTV